ncbi:hypothetical protein [Comamonas guangdongensis]|uniref:Uncharacterized protein n=1 Tax=Comamonas guangdongensis TaxID=510515 RepID=A0ABV3ZYA5_9BURK
MTQEETGALTALSMVVTAIVKALPPNVAHQVWRELRAAQLDAKHQDGLCGADPDFVQSRNFLANTYRDLLKAVADGNVYLVGGGKK